MQRKLLSLCDHAMGQRVRILHSLAYLLQFLSGGTKFTARFGQFLRFGEFLLLGPPSLCAVRSSGSGLCFGFSAPHEGAEVDGFSTVRAVHLPENNPAFAYEKGPNQSSPLPDVGVERESAMIKMKKSFVRTFTKTGEAGVVWG